MLRVGYGSLPLQEYNDFFECTKALNVEACKGSGIQRLTAEAVFLYAAMRNLSVKFIRSPEGAWGRKVNGTWNGLVKMLSDHEIDMTIPYMGYRKDRLEAISYSYPILKTSNAFVFHPDAVKGSYFSIQWFSLYDKSTILLILVSMLLLTLLARQKWLQVFLLWAEFFFIAYMDPVITSRLAIQERRVPFTNMSEIPKALYARKGELRWSTMDNTTSQFQTIKETKLSPFIEINEALQKYPTVPIDFDNPNYFLFEDRLYFDDLRREHPEHVVIPADDYAWQYGTSGIPKDWKYGPNLSNFYVRMQESGIWDYLERKYIPTHLLVYNSKAELEQTPVTLEHYMQHFTMYGVLIVLNCASLALEILVFQLKRQMLKYIV